MEIKVSIVIPVYKVEKYIERCLRSVFNQTYVNIECIIVNDCTPDGSFVKAKKLIETYEGNVDFKLLEHRQNEGLSQARNTGINNSTGDYIYFLDSDDRITENCIAKLVKTAKENNLPEIVMGVTKGVDNLGNQVSVSAAQTKCFMTNTDVFQGYINNEWYVIGCNKLIKKTIFDVHHTYFTPGIYHEDVMWSFEISTYVSSLVLCPHITYLYYIGDTNSISRSTWGTKRVSDSITILEKKAAYLDKVSNKYLLMRHIKDECYNMAYSLFRNHYSYRDIKQYMKRINVLMNMSGIPTIKSDVPFYRRVIYNLYKFL